MRQWLWDGRCRSVTLGWLLWVDHYKSVAVGRCGSVALCLSFLLVFALQGLP